MEAYLMAGGGAYCCAPVPDYDRSPLFKALDWRKALALDVFRHHTRLQELQQIVRAARLRANPLELEPAKRLPRHDRPRNVPVDI